MENLVYNSTTGKSVTLNSAQTEALYRGIVVLGSNINKTNWQKDLIIWISEHNPRLVGDGAAGFDITRMGWSREIFYVQRAYLLETLHYTIRYKSWNNFMISIDDEEATQKTLELVALFEEITIDDVLPGPVPFLFRDPEDTTYRWCKIHRNTLLNDAAISTNQNCIVCSTTDIDESIGLTIREIKLEGEWISERLCLEIILDVELDSKMQIYKIADRICHQNGFLLLGNKWCELDYEWATTCIRDGFTYDLAYNTVIDTDEIRNANIQRVEALSHNQEVICCLANTGSSPSHSRPQRGHYGNSLLDNWDFDYAYVIGFRNKIIFTIFWGSS